MEQFLKHSAVIMGAESQQRQKSNYYDWVMEDCFREILAQLLDNFWTHKYTVKKKASRKWENTK